MKEVSAMFCIAAVTAASTAFAQSPPLSISLPPTLIVPNYHRVQIGQREGLEGGAYVARTADATSNWFNPAGLALCEKTALSASANAYEWNSAKIEGLGEATGRSALNSVSTIVAAALAEPVIHSDNWRLGVSYTTPVSWRPAAIDDQFEQSAAGGTETFSLYSKSDFSQSIPAVGVAMRAGPKVRVGASVGLSMTSLYQQQEVSDVIVSGASTSGATRTFASDGSVYHGLVGAGMQWDVAQGWTFGAQVTSPGMRIAGTTLVRYQATAGIPSGHGWLTFRDEQARLDYHIPVYASAGVAWSSQRASVETDVRYHGSTDDYDLISSDALGSLSADTLTGPPVAATVPFKNSVNRARSVVDVAVGGHYAFSKSWIGHLGVYTDQSPVAEPGLSPFRQANLFGVTGGATLQGDHLSGSLGLGFSSGQSGTVAFDPLLGVPSGGSKLSISTLSVSYAISYKF